MSATHPPRLCIIACGLLPAWRLAALLAALAVVITPATAADAVTVAYVSKTQPVFRAGSDARIAVEIEVPDEAPSDQYLVVGVSDRTRLRGNVHVLFAEPLTKLGLPPGRQRHRLSVPLPASLPPGTAYIYGAVTTGPDLDRSSVLSYTASKIAVIDRDLPTLSLAEMLIPDFTDARGRPNFAALRSHLIARRDVLSPELIGPMPDAVVDPVRSADVYLTDRRLPLEFSTTQYKPGEAFWQSRDHPSDSLELQSLRFIQVLVLAYDRTGNTSYLEAAAELHADWATHNRVDSYLSPCAWSDHATAIRLRSLVALATRLAAHPEYDGSLELVLTDIYRHSKILAAWGFYSSWSNHGLFQDDALMAASVICGFFDRSSEWTRKTIRRTRDWFSRKVHPDGALNEGSSGYHFLVLRLALRVRQLAVAAGTVDRNLDDLLSRMTLFAKHLIKPNGRLVLFGDTAYGSPEDSLAWDTDLTAPPARRIAKPARESETRVGLFPASGYFFCIADCQDDVKDYYFALSCGVSTRATHFQDDSMTFELMLAGQTVVQDSGIFDYSDALINRYYKSPRAHNTVVFGDWSGSPYAHREIRDTAVERYWSTDDCFEITARMGTTDGSQLVRTVRGYPKDNVLVIRDRFRSTADGGVTFFFHYAPESEAVLADGRVALGLPNGRFLHAVLSSAVPVVSLHKGETDPAFLGWISLFARTKEPRWTAMVRFSEPEGELISVFARADTDIAPYLSESAECITSRPQAAGAE